MDQVITLQGFIDFCYYHGNFEFQTNFFFRLKMKICDVFMNEIKMEDEPLQEPKENANVQIEKKTKI
jgi:hypothetical protein